MMGSFPPEEAAAFQKDRADLTQGASITSFSAEAAEGYLHHYLSELDRSVSTGYLFGEEPTIADFSLYHCLWFLNNNPVNAPLLDRYGVVREWMSRMGAFGHGTMEDSDGEAALAAAKGSEPVLPALVDALPDGFALGDPVSVTPVDYGRVPVTGTLAAWSSDEVVISRETVETGAVLNHFPTAGFEIAKSG
jgi:hypothetical protein